MNINVCLEPISSIAFILLYYVFREAKKKIREDEVVDLIHRFRAEKRAKK